MYRAPVFVVKGSIAILEALFYSCSFGTGLGLIAAKLTRYDVERGHNAVLHNCITGAVEDKVYTPGRHPIIPWLQRPVTYDITAYGHRIETTVQSSDHNQVKVSLQIVERLIPEKLPTLHQTLGKNYKETVLPSISKVVEEVVGKYNATQLTKKTKDITNEIVRTATQRAWDLHVALDKVAITSITFSSKEAVDKKLKQEADETKISVIEAVKKLKQEADEAKISITEAVKILKQEAGKAKISTSQAFANVLRSYNISRI